MSNKTAYKGFDSRFNIDKGTNELYCRGIYFEVGKTYELDISKKPLMICQWGYHFCWKINDIHPFYSLTNSVICEIEILGDIVNEDDMSKACTNKFKIIRQLPKEEVLDLSNAGNNNTGFSNSGDNNSGDNNTGFSNDGFSNSGDNNTGSRNTGDMNTGSRNTGDMNTGDNNCGNRNTGHFNIGDHNSGNFNSGHFNSGNSNSGDNNTGSRNTGDMNTGSRNTGDMNTGDNNCGNRNTGHFNIGDHNSGNFNSGHFNSGNSNSGCFNSCNYSSGFFNTIEKDGFNIFNLPSEMSRKEFAQSVYNETLMHSHPWLTYLVYYTEEEMNLDKNKKEKIAYLEADVYKVACTKWWDKITSIDKRIIQKMPNFNKDIFFEITGIKL